MDRLQDNWKKYPLLVIGQPGISVPGAEELSLSAIGQSGAPHINNFYILLSTPSAELTSALKLLSASGFPREQLVACLSNGPALPLEFLPWAGTLEMIDGETPDEIRSRLLARLEAQRQKKLNIALQEAQERGITRNYPDAELGQLLDGTRIAHALACAYSLPPLSHSAALRSCLDRPSAPIAAWGPESSHERVIVDCAFLFLDCQSRGVNFREQLKERSAGLSFRARSELLHHIESGLGFLLGGKSNAA